MIWVSQIKNCVAYQHHQFFVFTKEGARKRLVGSLNNYTFAYPLPKLLLRCPELFPIAADYERCLFLLSLLFLNLLNHNARDNSPKHVEASAALIATLTSDY